MDGALSGFLEFVLWILVIADVRFQSLVVASIVNEVLILVTFLGIEVK